MADTGDDWHDKVLSMADDLELTGDDRRKYIHEHMTRKGYKMVPNYVRSDEEEDDNDDNDGFFGSGRSRQSRRRNSDDDGDRSKSRNKRGGSDNWYS